MNSRFAGLLKRFGEYFTASLLGTAVDSLVLWLCSHYLLNDNYFQRTILSPVISFECAVLTNFCSSYFVVWRDRISQWSVRSFFQHYAAYNLSCTGTFLIKLLFLQAVVLLTGLDVVWSNLIALSFSGLINFTMNEKVIFRRKKRKNAGNNRPGSPGTDPEAGE